MKFAKNNNFLWNLQKTTTSLKIYSKNKLPLKFTKKNNILWNLLKKQTSFETYRKKNFVWKLPKKTFLWNSNKKTTSFETYKKKTHRLKLTKKKNFEIYKKTKLPFVFSKFVYFLFFFEITQNRGDPRDLLLKALIKALRFYGFKASS